VTSLTTPPLLIHGARECTVRPSLSAAEAKWISSSPACMQPAHPVRYAVSWNIQWLPKWRSCFPRGPRLGKRITHFALIFVKKTRAFILFHKHFDTSLKLLAPFETQQ
jgi:hypothetical protein